MYRSTRQAARWLLLISLSAAWCGTTTTLALDIDGVQPAAMDQPRINLMLRRPSSPRFLTANASGTLTSNIEAFLDTGASGVTLSLHTADLLGIQNEKAKTDAPPPAGEEARFDDVGVGGATPFAISEPLLMAVAPSGIDPDNGSGAVDPNLYPQKYGPLRTEVGPLTQSSDLLASLAIADLDVVGMPAMMNKVVVMDMTSVNKLSDKMGTALYDRRSSELKQLPPSKLHVRLSYASFEKYTATTPADALPPTLAPSPFIGPGPFGAGSSPPLTLTHHGKTVTGTWLLDTGAVASMISKKAAQQLGVTYAADASNSDHPRLIGVPIDGQFTLHIAGIGGGKTAAGFYLDQLSLVTTEHEPLRYLHAPVLVADITIEDQKTHQQVTLDGVFGMNFLTASAKLDMSSLLGDFGNITKGAFRRVVLDQPAGLMGLTE